MSEMGIWFKCKGCGAPAGYFPKGKPPYWPPGTIAHSKPTDQVRLDPDSPSRIQCSVYHQLTASEYWELHKDSEKIESPTNMTPVLG